MSEIAEASEQQTLGVDQVNVVIQKMSRLTQESASNAEESASGAEELSGQSEELKGMVYAFRLTNRIGANTQPSEKPAQERSTKTRVPARKKPAMDYKGLPGKLGREPFPVHCSPSGATHSVWRHESGGLPGLLGQIMVKDITAVQGFVIQGLKLCDRIPINL
jgi:hypothetical protein